MFFTLSSEPDNRLPNHDRFGNYWFSHDDGWKNNKDHWYKGYNYPQINHGNFLKLNLISDSNVLLEHDIVRGFPLWWNNQTQTLTNLLGTGLQIWNNKNVCIRDHWLHDFDQPNYFVSELKELSFDQAVDLICENLVAKAQSLKNLNISKKLFLTGGIDTATIYSVLKYVGVEVELIDYEYIKYDDFLNKNFSKIKKIHWGYQQIHHWDKPTMLVSGAFGDEFLMRGPLTLAWWAAFNNIDLVELLKNNCDVYHHSYFLKDQNVKIFNNEWNSRSEIKLASKDLIGLKNKIINNVSNDHQHWHLGNTLTWTPFKDIELLKVCLSLNIEDLTGQALDATLNKSVIKKMYPKALSVVSRQKNTDSRENIKNI